MRTPKITNSFTLVVPAMCVAGLCCLSTAAQTPTPSPEQRKTVTTTTPVGRVIVENKPAAPQVVTILHSLNGLKVIRLLINKEQAEAIGRIDENFKLAGEVHTNVIAGLALDDGQTIAAW